MEEKYAMIGIFMMFVISISSFLVITSGGTGAATRTSYVSCCCNLLVEQGSQALVRTQIQTFANNCEAACNRYAASDRSTDSIGSINVFAQNGLCRENP